MDSVLMKKSTLMSLFFAVAFVLAGVVTCEASAADVSDLVSNCSNCHSAQPGKSPTAPTLAGQRPEYIENELQSYRQHGRDDKDAQVMWGVAQNLSDDEMKSLAKYYGSQPPAKGRASSSPALVEKGKLIYGGEGRGCRDCHGSDGEGLDAIPRLAGLDRDYLAREIREFRDGVRKFETMQGNTDKMTEDDVAAVAEFLASK
jgi:cytochrome c553